MQRAANGALLSFEVSGTSYNGANQHSNCAVAPNLNRHEVFHEPQKANT